MPQQVDQVVIAPCIDESGSYEASTSWRDLLDAIGDVEDPLRSEGFRGALTRFLNRALHAGQGQRLHMIAYSEIRDLRNQLHELGYRWTDQEHPKVEGTP